MSKKEKREAGEKERKREKASKQAIGHHGEMLVNQLIILKTENRGEKNQAFVLPFLYELHHWVIKQKMKKRFFL